MSKVFAGIDFGKRTIPCYKLIWLKLFGEKIWVSDGDNIALFTQDDNDVIYCLDYKPRIIEKAVSND